MQIVREPTGDSTTRLHEIMLDFTSPMRRVCPHLPDAALHEMIERMARHKLEQEVAKLRRARRSFRAASPHSRRSPGARPAMTLAS
jgi:hypothetical protein